MDWHCPAHRGVRPDGSAVYLVAVSLLLTLFTLFLLSSRTRSFFRMSLITGGVVVLLTFIPGIRAHDLGIRSQRARLEKVLPDLLVDGKIPSDVPYEDIAASEELKRKWETVSGAQGYLQKEMGIDKYEESYGTYGVCAYRESMLNPLIEDPGTGGAGRSPWAYYSLKEAVPLGDYTLLLPGSAFHYYEDSSVVVFYEDDSRGKELLRCEIVARLDSSNPDKLVYKNEKYLAVFDSITDYHHAEGRPAFITGGHTLYAKP